MADAAERPTLRREDAKWWIAQQINELEASIRWWGGDEAFDYAGHALAEYARAMAAHLDWIELADIFAGEMGLKEETDEGCKPGSLDNR